MILKFVHVAPFALWSGGLLTLPFLYVQRRAIEGQDLYRLHAFTRYLYVAIISPAAFVAIGSGTALIFLQATFVPWFSVKLVLIAIMTGIHIFSGLVILRLFEPGQRYPLWRSFAVTGLTGTVIAGILLVVLGKPDIGRIDDFDGLFEPGNLSRLAGQFTAWAL